MSRFKRCQIEGCNRTVSKPAKILAYKRDIAGIGQSNRQIKLKVCNRCFEDNKDAKSPGLLEESDPIDSPLSYKNVKIYHDP